MELELNLAYGLKSDKGGLKLLAPLRVIRRASLKRGDDFVADAPESKLEDSPHRRHMVHVIDERSADEHQLVPATIVERLERLVRNESLLLVELCAKPVDDPCRALPSPAAVHPRLEVERRLREQERHEVLPHRAVARLAEIQRVVVRMRGTPCFQVVLYLLVALRRTWILYDIAVPLSPSGIERAQLASERCIVLRLERIDRRFNGIPVNFTGGAAHRRRGERTARRDQEQGFAADVRFSGFCLHLSPFRFS